MPRSKGQIWESFEEETITEISNGLDVKIKVAKCKDCKKNYRLSGGNTSGMRNHLKRSHPLTFAALEKNNSAKKRKADTTTLDELDEKRMCDKNSENEKSDHNTIVSWTKYRPQDAQQLRADLEIMRAIARGNLPFSIVEQPWFRDLINHFSPRVSLKTSTTYSCFKLPLLYNNIKKAVDDILMAELPNAPGFAVSTDIWISKNMDPYQSLTIHYINKQFVLRRFVYFVKYLGENHTANAIAKWLDTTIAGIPGNSGAVPVTAVHDSAANMKAAILKSTKIEESLVCADHLLNHVMNDSIKQTSEVNAAVNRCTKLVTCCHKSYQANARIKSEIKMLRNDPANSNIGDLSFVKLITPVATRWNSVYFMIESVLKMRRPLESIFQNTGLDPAKVAEHVPSKEDFNLFEEIFHILKRFNDMSEVFSSDQNVTVHCVIAYIFGMHAWLDKGIQSAVSAPAVMFFQALKKNLNIRFPNYGSQNLCYAIGNLLNPLYRGFALKKASMFDWAYNILLKKHDSHQERLNQVFGKISEDSQSIDFCNIDDPLLQTMILEEPQSETSMPIKSNIEEEWDAYVALPKNTKDIINESCLAWWKANQVKFPLLSECARKWLSVPASSSTSKRIFSAGGEIVSHKRTKLQPELVVKLLFVQQNQDRVTIRKWILSSDEIEDDKEFKEIESGVAISTPKL